MTDWNKTARVHVDKFMRTMDAIEESRKWAEENQRLQRTIDKELNPRWYDSFIDHEGKFCMVEKPQPAEIWGE